MNGHIEPSAQAYSVPRATQQVFDEAILSNPLIRPDLPPEVTARSSSRIRFTGSASPSIPVNWRFAEAVGSLKALEAALVAALVGRKYRLACADDDSSHQEEKEKEKEEDKVTIDTDHATLFIMSTTLWTIDARPGGLNISTAQLRQANAALERLFPSRDIHRSYSSLHRALSTGIYRCGDGRFFNTHASMDPAPTLRYLGLPEEMETASLEAGVARFEAAMGRLGSAEVERLCNEELRQAGTVCWSAEEFRASEHGRANEGVGLWEIHERANSKQPAGWWPSVAQTGPSRPLAGLKVVDLTRVIAAPAITRGLAELGASVMRCTSPNLPDVSSLHPDLNWGKWNCSIDLKSADDRDKLRALIMEADVVVQGYRPGVLDKYGFGQQDIIEMCKDRERGVIYARENCYGWHGPWKDRSGWQQISDANVGVSLGFGKAMGHGEPVTPIFPHADYCTGIAGTCAILIALMRRGEKGGSYCVDLALNYYSSWLVNSVGEYPRAVFDKVWAEHDRQVFHNWHNNGITVPQTMSSLRAGPGGKRLFKPEFFEDRSAVGVLGEKKIRSVKPIATWPAGSVKLGFNVGTRGNGVDAARWPDDLMVESVV